MTDPIILNLQKIYKMTNVNFCDKTVKFNKNLNRIDTIQQAILSFRLYEWNGLHWYRTLGGYKMRRFNIIFKQYFIIFIYW